MRFQDDALHRVEAAADKESAVGVDGPYVAHPAIGHAGPAARFRCGDFSH